MLCVCLIASLAFYSVQAWHWKIHESKVELKSGLSHYTNAHQRPRFFAISVNNKLRERWWNGTSWEWSNHGEPEKLFENEKLSSAPCLMTEKNMFVITSKGRLVERFFKKGRWRWVHHDKPKQLAEGGIRPGKCLTTLAGGKGRVFVVGTDGELYERSFDKYWKWKTHKSPVKSKISGSEIDACTVSSCTKLVIYAVTTKGVLYGRFIEPVFKHLTHWKVLGKPPGMKVKSVSAGNEDGYVFVTTQKNNVCHFYEDYGGYYCFGKPPQSGSKKNGLVLSKPVVATSCSMLPPGAAWYMFVYAYDKEDESLTRVYILKSYSKHWLYLGRVKNGRHLVDAPVAYLRHGCPQGFFTEGKKGQLFEIAFW